MKTGLNTALDPSRRSNDAQEFETALRRRIVGQEQAIEKMAEIYQMFLAGLNPPGRPVGNLLFLGPTGSGKTRVVEACAEALFGDPRAMIKIDCAEFQHSHEIAKLIGSPPGYLGHRETHPLLTQEAINQWHTERLKLSLLLFDEIEKASDALWQLLLGILDKATLTLGDNRRVDLSCCIIVMTSNLGAGEMEGLISGGMGFARKPQEIDQRFDDKITRTAQDAARRKFSPEFMNRIDKVVVFKTLRPDHLEQILEIELGMVQQRVLQATGNNQFVFSCTPAVKHYLLAEGTDPKYGARHLKRSIGAAGERRVGVRDIWTDSGHIRLEIPEERDVVREMLHCLSGAANHAACAHLVPEFSKNTQASHSVVVVSIRMKLPEQLSIRCFVPQQITIRSGLFPEAIVLVRAFTDAESDGHIG
jgi:ATP-dependent Clp protease ATP-binding subunit ClpA